MSQNMLPFEKKEAKFFGSYSLMYIKMRLLRYIQGKSFKNSDGVIFLSNYAYDSLSKLLILIPKPMHCNSPFLTGSVGFPRAKQDIISVPPEIEER
mgnify:CR=1 FL=1